MEGCLLVFAFLSLPLQASSSQRQEPISVIVEKTAFAPEQSICALLKEKIASARERVDVMVFLLEWKPLADLLIEAQKRGIKVRVLVDERSSLPMTDLQGVC